MKAVSVHVVDIANGVVARGMHVQIARVGGDTVFEGVVGSNGVVADKHHEDLFTPGPYELRLHVAAYYRARGTVLPEPPFVDVLVFRFGIADTAQHYHLPVKLTPWGMSLFRGS
ncbi:hydroxyisourate hydrolase [uncultured Ramlibacter sp.]|uniref:hydroxyisourate hydrolase n=1 Tax=uncultured Ramlibacter sp. TaxID=260755 RepID=UPI0026125752|nr:hydroxyisourate hydrolase [uncultured Ramlibacter sp.]